MPLWKLLMRQSLIALLPIAFSISLMLVWEDMPTPLYYALSLAVIFIAFKLYNVRDSEITDAKLFHMNKEAGKIISNNPVMRALHQTAKLHKMDGAHLGYHINEKKNVIGVYSVYRDTKPAHEIVQLLDDWLESQPEGKTVTIKEMKETMNHFINSKGERNERECEVSFDNEKEDQHYH